MMLRRVAGIGLVLASVLSGCGSGGSSGPTSDPKADTCADGADLRLVWSANADEEGGDLFGLTTDGEVRQLTDDGGSYDPAFSPDGAHIVFSSVGDDGLVSDTSGPEGLDLYVEAVDGSGRKRLLDGDEDRQPAWSPDGTRIAFARHGGPDAGRLFVVEPDDPTGARILVAGRSSEVDEYPAWSHDGRSVAFIRTILEDGRPVEQRLVVADADGSDLRTVRTSVTGKGYLATPTWSPDGKRLLMASNTPETSYQALVAVGVADGATKVLANSVSAAVWTESGRVYAFARPPAITDASGNWRVAELDVDGDGSATGRAIDEIDEVFSLYTDYGIDAPPCQGPTSAPLTTQADVPDQLTVTDPSTGDDVRVASRDQAEALLAKTMGDVSATGVRAKLVPFADLGEQVISTGDHGLVWVVADEDHEFEGSYSSGVFDAVTGDSIQGGSIEVGLWKDLIDLAP